MLFIYSGTTSLPVPSPLFALLCQVILRVLESIISFRSFTMASEGVVCGPAGSSRVRTSQTFKGLEPAGSTSRQEVSLRPRDPPTSLMELIQCIIRKASFS